MSRIEDFKVIANGNMHKGESHRSVSGRIQYYLTDAELDAIGVDRSLIRSIKVAVSHYAYVDTEFYNYTSPHRNQLDVELYVKPVEVAINASRDGSSVRRASLLKLTSNSAVMQLLKTNTKTNTIMTNAILALTTVSAEFEQLVTLLADLLDVEFDKLGGNEVARASDAVDAFDRTRKLVLAWQPAAKVAQQA